MSGVLRIGNDTVVEGSLIAPGGVILGDRVVVHGNVLTHGTVQMGRDCRILGMVNPATVQPTPEREALRRESAKKEPTPKPAPRAPTRVQQPAMAKDVSRQLGAGVKRDATTELQFSTLETTMNILVSLAHEATDTNEGPIEEIDWGLPEDALEDMVAGLQDFIAGLFRGGDTESRWTEDEVFEILIKKVIGLIAPVSVEREERDRAVVQLGRPQSSLEDPERSSAGWVRPLLAVIHLLGSRVAPRFSIEPQVDAGQLRAKANPERIIAMVRI